MRNYIKNYSNNIEKDIIKGHIKKALQLKSAPRIIYFKQRKFSLIYEFIGDGKEFVLKIPKNEEKIKEFDKHVLKEEVKEKATIEWESLNYFYATTKNEKCPITFVKPVAYIPKLNGIVTEKVEGEDFYKLLREVPSKSEKERNKNLMRRIGEGFAYIHNTQSRKEKAKIEFSWVNIDCEKLDKNIADIFNKQKNFYSLIVKSMSGFDIRDVLVTSKNEIFFVDPGEIQEKSVYEILAKFLSTIKIARQGNVIFPFKKIDKVYEEYFLSGYFKNEKYDKKLLGLSVLAELTKRYNQVRKNLNRKFPNIPFLKYIIKTQYINPFYYREIKKTIEEYGL